MAEDSDLFLFGDDLDAVLEALEANDIVDESFNEAVTEVRQIIQEFFVLNSLFYAVLGRFYRQFFSALLLLSKTKFFVVCLVGLWLKPKILTS